MEREVCIPPAKNNTVSTWAAAVHLLWLTPMPRIIVAESGGQQFIVYGGGTLRMVARAVPSNDRREIFRSGLDPKAPMVDLGGLGEWNPATSLIQAPSHNSKTILFDCYFLSGKVDYNRGTAGQAQFVLNAGFQNGTTTIDDSNRCVLRVTMGSNHENATDVAMQSGQPAKATGLMQVDVLAAGSLAVVRKNLTIYRFSGGNRIADGDNGHNMHLYGYMLQDETQSTEASLLT